METHEQNEDVSFEDAMKQLEDIVEQLEESDVPLEKAIDHYQKGMQLSTFCHNKLKQVQDKMTKIVNDQGEEEPFTVQEDE